jgi:folate-binding protein YgfZ
LSVHSCALHSETLVHLRGADIAEFLQGQLSCDTRQLSRDRPVFGAFCNPKGRVLADLCVLQFNDEHCALRMRKSIAASCASTLDTYARFSRIECLVDNDAFALMGMWGGNPDAIPGESGFSPPPGIGVLTRSEDSLCYMSAPGMIEIVGPSASIAERIAAASDIASSPEKEQSEEQWAAQALLNGSYRIEADDIGEFTPQALNFDLAGYVSFNKGCYTGQEVVARLHYKGQSKRRLAVFVTPDTPQPLPNRGTVVLSQSGARVGKLLRSYRDSRERQVLAVAILVESANDPALRLQDAPERILAPVTLSY